MANGMDGSIVPSSPLGNGFILFYVGRMEVVRSGTSYKLVSLLGVDSTFLYTE